MEPDNILVMHYANTSPFLATTGQLQGSVAYYFVLEQLTFSLCPFLYFESGQFWMPLVP